MKRLQRMPGTSFERPRACKLTEIEPHQSTKTLTSGCSRTAEDVGSPLGSAAGNMGSVARFPKLDECAHFHYEHVELGNLEVSVSDAEDQQAPGGSFAVRVTSGDACWTLQRTYENLVLFDKQLHRCIFDRKFSMLANLAEEPDEQRREPERLKDYLRRFSCLSHEGLNCGPVLNWLQLDNRGRRILVPESDSCPINTPAVAAAYAVRPYQAQAQDEISFQVGDMISVIDMPPAGESSWWRGKHGFAVGFFPAECVAVIGDKLPRHLGLGGCGGGAAGGHHHQPAAQSPPGRLQPARLQQQPVKPVLRKHGKLIAFFRSFILNRPSRRRLKQSGILRERVFGCDLGEHLLNSGQEVPCVLRCCAEFIERHGIVDGIYRLSGVSSNIQRLRHAFDEDRVPALHSDEGILQDIHSVASLLKMYFRELPNPLCTYQLYSTFVGAVQSPSDTERLARMRDAVRKLPPPHYRTLEYLMRHLVRVAARGEQTGMTPRNVAIVWAPNLLRCKELEVGGVAALQGVGVQAVVTEFLICYAELIFASGPSEGAGSGPGAMGQRPKSLAFAGASARLLSLEEARSRSLAAEPDLMEVGAGSAGLPLHYHTVIELPQLSQRKRAGSKRSPSLNWRALFGGRQSAKPRGDSEPSARQQQQQQQPAAAAKLVGQGSLRRLRPVKSADSLDGGATATSSGTEDCLGPLLGPSSSRPCGHSRSVSHDSYFEHLGDAASAGSPLDLSEIQLSFELEEREMRMLSEGESGRQSLEASPRRQRSAEPAARSAASSLSSLVAVATPGPTTAGGGSKRKRSRLEERLQCDVELRFIDSQSPDQVMVSADVHEMETPSPLPTPGYLPLLSEASTPLTPTTTPAAVSPRISFKSFTIPLDVCDQPVVPPDKSGGGSGGGFLHSCLTKADVERDSTSTALSLECNQAGLRINQSSVMEASDNPLETPLERPTSLAPRRLEFELAAPLEIVDQEMMPCERLLDLDSASEMSEATYHGLDVSPSMPNVPHRNKEQEMSAGKAFRDAEATRKTRERQAASVQNSNLSDLSCSSNLDSLMPYEQETAGETSFTTIDSNDEASTKLLNYKNDLESSEKWPTSNLSSATTQVAMEDNRLQESVDSQTSAMEECRTSSNSPKHCSGSICYSFLDNMYSTERSGVPLNQEFNTASEDNYNIKQSNKNNQNDQKKILNPEPLETDFILLSPNLESNQSNCENTPSQLNANIKSFTSNYSNDQMRNEITSWDSLLADKNVCEINQNNKEKSLDEDQGNRFFDQEERERVKPVALILDCQEKNINKDIYDESKISQNNSESNRQISNNNICASLNEFQSKLVDQESSNSNSFQSSSIRDDIDVVVPSDSAAVEPLEMAHVPEVLSENIALSSPINNANLDRNSILRKDTATILQELALQRLSGGDRVDSINTRRRYDSDSVRDRRSFDSEIGREIVREHKMKQELEHARGKLDESLQSGHNQNSSTHLPPCLRARHARATRAALSRSLDEAKFNKMTSNCGKQNKSEGSQQHGSTPNVGSKLSSSNATASERSTQSLNKNLGLDLDDPRCRERIEKYKEERRTFLRDKYRSESFRTSSSASSAADGANNKEDGEQALLARLKQRASRPSLL